MDIAFLAIVPAVLLGRYFETDLPPRLPGFKNELVFLGHFTLIVMAIMVLLVERRVNESGYGFLPNRREWQIGALHYLYFLPLGRRWRCCWARSRWKARRRSGRSPATFLGFLWTIALSEEFFFRGVLQQWIQNWTWSRTRRPADHVRAFRPGPHRFRRQFPNWQWVLIAAVLGWCCGRARNQAGSIRAAMVTHALVVATWRGFFLPTSSARTILSLWQNWDFWASA